MQAHSAGVARQLRLQIPGNCGGREGEVEGAAVEVEVVEGGEVQPLVQPIRPPFLMVVIWSLLAGADQTQGPTAGQPT
jgi:hypothetical protein